MHSVERLKRQRHNHKHTQTHTFLTQPHTHNLTQIHTHTHPSHNTNTTHITSHNTQPHTTHNLTQHTQPHTTQNLTQHMQSHTTHTTSHNTHIKVICWELLTFPCGHGLTYLHRHAFFVAFVVIILIVVVIISRGRPVSYRSFVLSRRCGESGVFKTFKSMIISRVRNTFKHPHRRQLNTAPQKLIQIM